MLYIGFIIILNKVPLHLLQSVSPVYLFWKTPTPLVTMACDKPDQSDKVSTKTFTSLFLTLHPPHDWPFTHLYVAVQLLGTWLKSPLKGCLLIWMTTYFGGILLRNITAFDCAKGLDCVETQAINQTPKMSHSPQVYVSHHRYSIVHRDSNKTIITTNTQGTTNCYHILHSPKMDNNFAQESRNTVHFLSFNLISITSSERRENKWLPINFLLSCHQCHHSHHSLVNTVFLHVQQWDHIATNRTG